jgi:integrase
MNPQDTGRVTQFLKLYTSKSTLRIYRWVLTNYFKSIFPAESINNDIADLERLAERYFTSKRDYEKDIQDYFALITQKPPKTVSVSLACVRTFLAENDVELPAKFWRRLRRLIHGSRALTQDHVPNNQELKRIIMHMPIHGKAFYLMLESSGMRINEGLRLTDKNLDRTAQPCKISVPGPITKTGNPRITFMSKEALMFLEEWLKVRSDYLKAAVRKSHEYGKKLEDPRLFPFEMSVAYSMWDKALAKSGYLKRDDSTQRRTMHPHVLRKFFRTRLGSIISPDVVEALMGHEEGLTEVYRKYSEEDLAKFYLQGESALLIFTEAEEVSKLRVEVEKKSGQMQDVVNMLVTENAELKRRLNKIEEKLPNIEKLLEELVKEQTS